MNAIQNKLVCIDQPRNVENIAYTGGILNENCRTRKHRACFLCTKDRLKLNKFTEIQLTKPTRFAGLHRCLHFSSKWQIYEWHLPAVLPTRRMGLLVLAPTGPANTSWEQ